MGTKMRLNKGVLRFVVLWFVCSGTAMCLGYPLAKKFGEWLSPSSQTNMLAVCGPSDKPRESEVVTTLQLLRKSHKDGFDI